MNKQIKLLAEKAGLQPYYEAQEGQMENFAKLIVLECADFVQFYYQDHACEGIAHDMKTHFGVDECQSKK